MLLMFWCCCFYYPRFKEAAGNSSFGWDAGGYYWYLPSIFIYHDLDDQLWADSILQKYDLGPRGAAAQGFKAPNGKVVMKYPCGMAVLEAPFFFTAHVLAKPSGYPADGFSRPYQLAVQLGGLIVAFIGLWGLRRFLKLYFSDTTVGLTILILVIGTNYLNYSTTDNTTTHSWLFTLYVLLLLTSRSFYAKPTLKAALIIGTLCGLAVLIRPTDIISCIIPLLWGLESLRASALRAHCSRLWLQRSMLVPALLMACAVVSLQLFYWKAVSGQWIVYSYQDQGFSFLHPHVLNFTFSYRSGWLTYTPVMLLALTGIGPFLRKGFSRVMVLVFLGIAYYLVVSWDIWWYGGMGGRAMVQYYPVISIFFAAGMQWIGTRTVRILIAGPIVSVLCLANIWFMYQAHHGKLYDADGGMSRAYYWRVIGRITAPSEVAKLKDGPFLFEAPIPADAKLLYANSLHQISVSGADSLTTINAQNLASENYTFTMPSSTVRWLRASARFHSVSGEPVKWKMLQFCMAFKGVGELHETMIRVQRLINPGETKQLSVDLKLPETAAPGTVQVHFWNVESTAETQIDSLQIWGW